MDYKDQDEFEHCDEQLWRYVDLWKFVDLIANRKLHLTKLFDFEDKHEGCLPRLDTPYYIEDEVKEAMARNPQANEDVEREYVRQQIRNGNRFRRNSFASCWFASDYQSAAMWQLYCPHSLGVAIQSTERDLDAALDQPGAPGYMFEPVHYIDYEWGSMYDLQKEIRERRNDAYVLSPVQCKRKEFEHEREWRVSMVAQEVDGKLLGITPDADPFEPFIRLDVDPNILIKRILLPPKCQLWQIDIVKKLIEPYGIQAPIQMSGLLNLPD
jgi:hypothetical protein